MQTFTTRAAKSRYKRFDSRHPGDTDTSERSLLVLAVAQKLLCVTRKSWGL